MSQDLLVNDESQIAIELWRTSLEEQGSASFTVSGGSMEPTLKAGTVMSAVKVNPEALTPGELAVIERDGTVIVHRIIDRFYYHGELFLVEKGDAERICRAVPAKSVIGRALFSPHMGRDRLTTYYAVVYKLKSRVKYKMPGPVQRFLWKLILSGEKLFTRS